MKRFGRDKIALFLTCMSVFSNRASAMDASKIQNPQTVAAVGGATSRNNQSVKQGLSKNQELAIVGAASLAVVSAIGLTIWGVTRNKNNGGQNNGEQGDQEKIAQQNLEIIHKKFDDFYQGDEEASEKAKKIFDSVKSQMSNRDKWDVSDKLLLLFESLVLNYFVNVLSGKTALDEESAKNIRIVKAVERDYFAISIYSGTNCFTFGYDSKAEKCFHT